MKRVLLASIAASALLVSGVSNADWNVGGIKIPSSTGDLIKGGTAIGGVLLGPIGAVLGHNFDAYAKKQQERQDAVNKAIAAGNLAGAQGKWLEKGFTKLTSIHGDAADFLDSVDDVSDIVDETGRYYDKTYKPCVEGTSAEATMKECFRDLKSYVRDIESKYDL